MRNKKQTKPSKEKIGIAGNIPAAASRLGLSEQVVRSAKDAGAPGWKANNNIDCDELWGWIVANPDFLSKQGEKPDKELEDALFTRAKRQMAEIKRDQLSGVLVMKADMKRSVGKMQIAAKQKLYSGEAAHVAEVTMKGALTAEQAEIVRSSYHAIIVDVLKELHKGEWGNPECPECKAKL